MILVPKTQEHSNGQCSNRFRAVGLDQDGHPFIQTFPPGGQMSDVRQISLEGLDQVIQEHKAFATRLKALEDQLALMTTGQKVTPAEPA